MDPEYRLRGLQPRHGVKEMIHSDSSDLVEESKHKFSHVRRRYKVCLTFYLPVFLLLVVAISFVVSWITYIDPCTCAQHQLLRSKSTITDAFIPKIIHQQWKTENIPDSLLEWRELWLKLFPEPEYMHILWTDASAEAFIRTQYSWFLPYYLSYEHGIQRADAVRYFILYHYGGIYADLDYEPLVNFWAYLMPNKVSLIESPYWYNHESVQNSLMASNKGNPFWNKIFELLITRSNSSDILYSTGPWMLTHALEIADKSLYDKLNCRNYHRVPTGNAFHAPVVTEYMREITSRTPLVRRCGDWRRTDDCQFGIHHNVVSWQGNSLDFGRHHNKRT